MQIKTSGLLEPKIRYCTARMNVAARACNRYDGRRLWVQLSANVNVWIMKRRFFRVVLSALGIRWLAFAHATIASTSDGWRLTFVRLVAVSCASCRGVQLFVHLHHIFSNHIAVFYMHWFSRQPCITAAPRATAAALNSLIWHRSTPKWLCRFAIAPPSRGLSFASSAVYR